jgi:hypothetical protein
MSHQFPLPPIEDEALLKFCQKHDVFEAVAAGYHYAQKFFPSATHIDIHFYPPYREDEPEEAAVDFVIETDLTVDAVLDARRQFVEATKDIPGAFYLVTSFRFTKNELS